MRSQTSSRPSRRTAGMNLERAGLHQRDQIVELFHRDDVMLLGVHDMAQRRVLDGGGDVFLEERFAADALRSAHDGERPVDDVRGHDIPHADVIFRQVLLGDADVGPIDAVGMGQMDIGDRVVAICGFAAALVRRRRRRFSHRLALRGAAGERRRRFAHHFARRLVLAQPFIGGLAQQAVMREAAKLRLDDHLRLDPDDVLAPFVLGQRHRRTIDAQRLQPLPQIAGHLLGVAGADAAGIAQLAVFVKRHRQRADGFRQRRRRRKTGNDEFLRVVAFGFDEIVRPPRA